MRTVELITICGNEVEFVEIQIPENGQIDCRVPFLCRWPTQVNPRKMSPWRMAVLLSAPELRLLPQ